MHRLKWETKFTAVLANKIKEVVTATKTNLSFMRRARAVGGGHVEPHGPSDASGEPRPHRVALW